MHEVIIVEDSADLRSLLAEVLHDEGYAVRTCADGRTALDVVSTMGPSTCVLLDLMLPVVTGHEVLSAIRQLPFHVPVLVLSADPSAGETDADVVLDKPFDLARLLEAVERLLSKAPPLQTKR